MSDFKYQLSKICEVSTINLHFSHLKLKIRTTEMGFQRGDTIRAAISIPQNPIRTKLNGLCIIKKDLNNFVI